jgi:hypothetical protein
MKHRIPLNLDSGFALLQIFLHSSDFQIFVNTPAQEIGSWRRKIRITGHSRETNQLEPVVCIAITRTPEKNKAKEEAQKNHGSATNDHFFFKYCTCLPRRPKLAYA